jgi:hypothetical protein
MKNNPNNQEITLSQETLNKVKNSPKEGAFQI